MSSFLAIKKVFDLSASNNAQMLVGRQSRELSASGNDVITTMKQHVDYTVDVSFDSAGGTACASSTYVLGQQYKDLPTTTRSSYIFQGWFTQLTGGTQISAGSTVELSTTTLHAQWKYADVGTDYTEYVVKTTSSYKKTGIYSATRYSSASPVIVDWGDGNVEAIEGNISQLSHEYSSVGVFHVKISNISNFAASASNSTWYGTTSQNRYTFKDIVKTGSHCTSMPTYAFYYCSALSSINFLSSCWTSLTSLPAYAFYYCTSLTQLSSLPSRIRTLGGYCFRYCTGLTGIQDLRSAGLTLCNNYAFANCSNVREWKLPASLGAYFGTYQFYYNSSLSAIELPSQLTSIPNYCFDYCQQLKSITIPNKVKSIGTYAFRYCYNLKTLEIPSALTSIGNTAFSGCRSLSSITDYRLTAQTVGANTFGSATGTSTTAYTGYNTRGSNKLRIYSAATGYDSGYWLDPLQNTDKCGFSIEYIDGQQLTCTVTLNAGEGSVSPTSVDYVYGATMSTLPTPTPPSGKIFTRWNTSSDGTGTTYTASSAAPSQATLVLYAIYEDQQGGDSHADTWYKYAGDTEWRTASITGEINSSSIPNVANIIALEIGSDVTSIGNQAFYYCNELTSATIPDSVTSIGFVAFAYCHNLNNIIIPSNCAISYANTFRNCSSMSTITFENKTMAQVQSMTFYSFGLQWYKKEGNYVTVTNIICSDGTIQLNRSYDNEPE